ncbi:MAG: DnaD domain protein, partial [Anaerolineales bacterium]|nr:DnaD domain protein [Anaerolineales bacterium]
QVSIPEVFFREALAQVDDLDTLKVILFAFWRLEQKEGAFRYLRREDFLAENWFMAGLGGQGEVAQGRLEAGLAGGTACGVLLRADWQGQGLYFLNTPKGQAAVEAVARGEWRLSGEEQAPVEVRPTAPNLFRLYEENIGPLTPLVAEALREAEEAYPFEWIEEAVRIAVENNARNWRYVTAILERWKDEGRGERKGRRDTEKDRRRYEEWEKRLKGGR